MGYIIRKLISDFYKMIIKRLLMFIGSVISTELILTSRTVFSFLDLLINPLIVFQVF
jgi:hypothetical protein